MAANSLIQELTMDVLPPITANGPLQLDGVVSMTIHNNGTVNATINGNFTIKPGSTFQIASPNSYVIIEDTIRIAFASGAGTKLLEVAVLRMKGGIFSNYEKQPIFA